MKNYMRIALLLVLTNAAFLSNGEAMNNGRHAGWPHGDGFGGQPMDFALGSSLDGTTDMESEDEEDVPFSAHHPVNLAFIAEGNETISEQVVTILESNDEGFLAGMNLLTQRQAYGESVRALCTSQYFTNIAVLRAAIVALPRQGLLISDSQIDAIVHLFIDQL